MNNRATSLWQSHLDNVRAAIVHLRKASQADGDVQRASTADWLDALFADVTNAVELRTSTGRALTLFRGGMGSFQDVGTATMSAAVGHLNSALRAVR